MPTQEERIAAVETAIAASQPFQQQVSQFQQEAMVRIRETEAHTTILLGVTQSQEQDSKRIVEHLDTHTELLRQILARLPDRNGE